MKIILIDDQPITRYGVLLLVQSKYPNVPIVELNNVQELNKMDNIPGRSIVLLGVNILSRNATVSAMENILAKDPLASILILDHSIEDVNVLHYLKSGALAYVTKRISNQDFLVALTSVVEGKRYLEPEVQSKIINSYVEGGTSEPTKPVLTAQEHKVANLISQGVPVSTIATMIERDQSTVSLIKSKILKKLNVTNVFELRDKIRSM